MKHIRSFTLPFGDATSKLYSFAPRSKSKNDAGKDR
jgi:hypothetical protein